jgi:hypothetical protein
VRAVDGAGVDDDLTIGIDVLRGTLRVFSPLISAFNLPLLNVTARALPV